MNFTSLSYYIVSKYYVLQLQTFLQVSMLSAAGLRRIWFTGEELIFNIEYLSKCRSCVINDERFYCYRKHPNSVTTESFSYLKLTEITSKDEAKRPVTQYCLSLLKNCGVVLFAHMNVMRAIYKARAQDKYRCNVDERRAYVLSNYSEIKTKLLSKKT